MGSWSRIGAYTIYVVLVLDNLVLILDQWRWGGSLSCARSSYTKHRDRFKKVTLVILTLSIHQLLNWVCFFFFFMPMFSPNPFIYIHITHIGKCMCNSLKRWLKHPLPKVGGYVFLVSLTAGTFVLILDFQSLQVVRRTLDLTYSVSGRWL